MADLKELVEKIMKEQIKEDCKEILSDNVPNSLDGLKPELNSLLMCYLPEDVTIKEADALAMALVSVITNPYEFIRD